MLAQRGILTFLELFSSGKYSFGRLASFKKGSPQVNLPGCQPMRTGAVIGLGAISTGSLAQPLSAENSMQAQVDGKKT
jgi:hypothetical protein